MTIQTLEAAKKICELGDWGVTNLQLQRVLYLAHMMFMGRNDGEPLISGQFQATDCGPVVPELYEKMRMYGASPIRCGFFPVKTISSNTREGEVITQSCAFFFPKTPSELVCFTHRDTGAFGKNYVPSLKCVIPNDYIYQEYLEIGDLKRG